MTRWHIAVDLLTRYARCDATMVERSSVEAHLLGCDECRAALGAARDEPTAAAIWLGVADRIDVSRRSRRGVPRGLAIAVAGPVLCALMFVVVVTLIGSVALVGAFRTRASLAMLIGLAPAAPVALVVAAFRPELDPAGGLAVATPMAGGRLPFLRALLGSLLALAAGAAASTFSPLPADLLLTWLLPGATLAAMVLASATYVNPLRVAVPLTVGWWCLVGVWLNRSRHLSVDVAIGDLVTNQAHAQIVCLALSGVAAAVLLKRRNELPAWRTA